MVTSYTKKNTTWTFCVNGAIKETKTGQTLFPEYKPGTDFTNKFIEQLEQKGFAKHVKK